MSGRGAAATAFWASVVVLGVVLVGFSTSSHIEWIIEMAFGRYLWLSSAILVKETASNNLTIKQIKQSNTSLPPLYVL